MSNCQTTQRIRMNADPRPAHAKRDRAIQWIARFLQPRLVFQGPEALLNGDFYKKRGMWMVYKVELAEFRDAEGLMERVPFRSLVDAEFNYVRFLPGDRVPGGKPLTYNRLPWMDAAPPVVHEADDEDDDEDVEEDEDVGNENQEPQPMALSSSSSMAKKA